MPEQMMSIEEKRKLDAEAKANSGARTDLSAASSDRLSKEVARLEDLERIGTILEIMRYLLDTNNTNPAFLSTDLVL